MLPHDSPETPAERVASLAVLDDRRLIAERLTAAWIWGALAAPPEEHTLAFATAEKVRVVRVAGLVLRQVRFAGDEVVALAGSRVSTPLRTLVDLARVGPDVPDAVILALATAHGVTLAQALERVLEHPHLPDKRIAVQRLQRIASP